MDFETFKKINQNKTPFEKFGTLIEEFEIQGNNRVSAINARWNKNHKDVAYYQKEVEYHTERLQWLYDELSTFLKEFDIEPCSEAEFKEIV